MATRHILCNNCKSDSHESLVTVRGNRGVPFISKYHTVVVCKDCGLVFLNPQHEPEDYKKFYSGLNIKGIQSEDVLKAMHDPEDGRIPVRDFLLRTLPVDFAETNRTLLDVGCGVGVFLHQMKKVGFEVEGLEPGVHERAFAKGLGLTVHEGMLSEHSLPKNHYDVVTALACIEHVNDPLTTLQDMWGLVKEGGYCLLTTPSYHHMNLRHGPENYFKFVHTFYFSEVSLASLMKQAGFTIVSVWVKESPSTKSFLFGRVPTRGGGLLCILGKKESGIPHAVPPERENAAAVIASFARAKKAARLQYSLDRMTRYSRAVWQLIKKKIVSSR